MTEPLGWALACATTIFVAFVPGTILLGLFAPAIRRQRVLWFAASVPVTVGWLFAVSEALGLLGLPTSPATQSTALAAAIAIGVFVRRGSAQAATAPVRHRIDPDRAISVIMLTISMAIGVAVWSAALVGQPHNPPSRDGEYHGYFVKRIAETGSVSPAAVVTTDPVTEEQASTYYPLAMHNAVALQYMIFGQEIGLLLTCWVVICSALVLPAGLFVLVRRLVPHKPLAAGFTALLTPFVAMFPYRPAAWSGLSLIVGMAFVPVALVLVGQAGDALQGRRWRSVGAAVLAVFGIASTHTSELGLLAMWLPILTLADARRDRVPVAIRRRAVSLGAVVGLAALLDGPALVALGGASAERAAFAGQPYLTISQAVGELATLSHAMPTGQGTITLLVIVGLWLAARDRVLGAWAVCMVGVVGLFLASAVVGGPFSHLRPLTQLWYSNSWRLSYNVALSMTVVAGYALSRASDLSTWAFERWPRLGQRTSRMCGPTMVAVAFGAVSAAAFLQQPKDIVRTAYATNSPASGGQLKAFDFLSTHVPAGQPVLNEERDGSAWMYAEHGLLPLMGVYKYTSTELTGDRIYLATHIAEYSRNERVRALIDTWNIQYVLVNETGFIGEPPRVAPSDLGGTAFTEVFTADGSHVYRINR